MHARRTVLLAALLLGSALLPAAPGLAQDTTHHHVKPGDSIQDAVDAADPGDTVHVHAGTYTEAVRVTTTDLTITGDGASATVLDGTGIQKNGIYINADDVAVQDLAVKNFGGNGVFYEDVQGFYMDRLHAEDNGPYGLYAIGSTLGHIKDSYAAGHKDSGLYIGQTASCECVLSGNLVEDNLIGYSGTGASHVIIRDNVFRHNAAGVVPNVLPSEPLPQTHLVVVNNEIVDNNNEEMSDKYHFTGGFHVPEGLGVVIAGGSRDIVRDNVITGHVRAGVSVVFLFTEPSLNQIVDNTLNNPATEENPKATDILWDGGGANNCFEGNVRPDGSPVTFDGGAIWNTLGRPDCSTNYATPPEPSQTARELALLLGNCEPEQVTGYPAGPCHLEAAPSI